MGVWCLAGCLALLVLIPLGSGTAWAGVRTVDAYEAERLNPWLVLARRTLEARTAALKELSGRNEALQAMRKRQELASSLAEGLKRTAQAERQARRITRDAAAEDAVRAERMRLDLETDLKRLMGETMGLSRQPNGDQRRVAQLRAYTRSLVSGLAEAEMEQHEALARERAAESALRAAETHVDAATAALGREREALAALEVEAAELVAKRLEAGRRQTGAVAWLKRLERAERERRTARQLALVTRQGQAVPATGLQSRSLLRPLPALSTPVASVAPVERPLLPVSLRRTRTTPAALHQTPPGTFVLPVDGLIVERFEAGRTRDGAAGRGIRIETNAAAVQAPWAGRVVFAGPFKRFGLLLIIDHGQEYHSLLTGLSSLAVEKGDAVEAGQRVGEMVREPSANNQLYLELRHRGVPVNPLPWLASGQDKVRG